MAVPLFELTSFQRDVLYVASGLDRPSGQEIKDEFEAEVGDITHGRLYPTLDELVEKGYLEKGEVDRRTNFYELSREGGTALVQRRQWEDSYADIE